MSSKAIIVNDEKQNAFVDDQLTSTMMASRSRNSVDKSVSHKASNVHFLERADNAPRSFGYGKVGNSFGIAAFDHQQCGDAAVVERSSSTLEYCPGVTTERSAADVLASSKNQDEQRETVRPLMEEFTGLWCDRCGDVQTHKKEAYGPFRILVRMKPLTMEGCVYDGYCLSCYDVYELQGLLEDPNIPIDLLQQNPEEDGCSRLPAEEIAAPSHQEEQQHNTDGLFALQTRKESRLEGICSSIHFQIICCVVLVIIVGGNLIFGLFLSQQQQDDGDSVPTVSDHQEQQKQWNLVSTVLSNDNIESFGYDVVLSHDGTIMAVASPAFHGSRGRLDIFHIDDKIPVGWQSVGTPIIGNQTDDQLALGMHMSGDGTVVAVGLPGNNAGTVQVYSILDQKTVSQKGQSIQGPTPLSQFGYSVALNLDGSRLFVGAPQFAENPNEIYGIVQVFDFDGTAWVPVGSDIMVLDVSASRFGHSIATNDSGNRVAVGDPLAKNGAGEVTIFDLVDMKWVQFQSIWLQFPSQLGSQLGRRISMDCEGSLLASGGRDRNFEDFSNAGVVMTWSLKEASFIPDEPDGIVAPLIPISGTSEESHLGLDVALANFGNNISTIITSSVNRNGQVGSVILAKVELGHSSTVAFSGLLLGDTVWLGKGPSVATAVRRPRFAIGYESIRESNAGKSRPEIRIYDYFISVA